MKFDQILQFVAQNFYKIHVWLSVSILLLPVGVICGKEYFSISMSCFGIVLINLFIKVVNYFINKYHNSAYYKQMFEDFYSELKEDEKSLLKELAIEGIAYRNCSDFAFEGSYGLRSQNFYFICSFPDEFDVKPITSSRLFDNNCNKYKFTLNSRYHKIWKKYLRNL